MTRPDRLTMTDTALSVVAGWIVASPNRARRLADNGVTMLAAGTVFALGFGHGAILAAAFVVAYTLGVIRATAAAATYWQRQLRQPNREAPR